MNNYGQITHRTSDDSYVITKNGYPYQVYPYASEFAAEWDEVNAYAEEHPEEVTEEYPHVVTLAEAKAAKLAEINAAADAAISAMTATYPAGEVATFDKQEAEARAYTANPESASTPLLSALSAARGMELAELVRRVLAKADAFAVASGAIIGQRQALEDVLDTCTTVDAVQAIPVGAFVPEGRVETTDASLEKLRG